MNTYTFFILLFVTVLAIDGRYPPKILKSCHTDTCKTEFNCNCEGNWFTYAKTCIPLSWTCDGWKDCDDGSDELDCECLPDHFQCGCHQGGGCSDINEMYHCIPDAKVCDGRSQCVNQRDEINCNGSSFFQCSSEEYISDKELCDGKINCDDGYSDEADCPTCPVSLPYRCDCNKANNTTCRKERKGSFKTCFGETERCNGKIDCVDKSDEMNCTSCPDDRPYRCDCNQPGNNTCTGSYSCYSDKLLCNGVNDCSDNTDEQNCTSCPKRLPNRCSCNQPGNNTCTGTWFCYSKRERCDGVFKCSDGSDEANCVEDCSDGDFVCDCVKSTPPTCSPGAGCVSNSSLYNGKADCPDNSDESDLLRGITCGACNLSVHRLKNMSECDSIGLPYCDVRTCYYVQSESCATAACTSVDVICTSECEHKSEGCQKIFQCANGGLMMQYEFCNHEIDCSDGSDEVRNQSGFKCSNDKSCVLPQRNLFDDVDHCGDGSDLCSEPGRCFTCLDNKLMISSAQICDGIIDCHDLSDECFCVNISTETFVNSSVCTAKFSFYDPLVMKCLDPSTNCTTVQGHRTSTAKCGKNTESGDGAAHSCSTKYGTIIATVCDGRPECSDFSDECGCVDPPSFCGSFCSSFYPLGDRYCDGIEDEQAWVFINDSRCPKGFDERDCPARFYCRVGNRVSIDISQKCDGIKHCDDGSDEAVCSDSLVKPNEISSDTEMIKSLALRIIVWVVGFVTIIGNSCVIFSTVRVLTYSRVNLTDIEKCSRLLMLNLSCADFIMGIYLLIIAIQSAIFSGDYGKYDYQWRTSTTCRAAGTLAIFSSETSCFLMSLMTVYRLYNVYNPFNPYGSSRVVSKWCIPGVWILSFILAMVPNLASTSEYFVQQFWYPDISSKYVPWDRDSLMNYACRLSSLNNSEEVGSGNGIQWYSAKQFLSDKFPEYSPKIVGYYGETSVCLPRFYVKMGDSAWEYSFAIITINFLSFFFVAIGYCLIYYLTSNSSNTTTTRSNSRTAFSTNHGAHLSQNAKIQKRIARLILTDFVCWMPICIMAYVKLSGLDLLPYTYAVSAIILLPINSALNPLLYTKFSSAKKRGVSRSRTTNMTIGSMVDTPETVRLQPLQ